MNFQNKRATNKMLPAIKLRQATLDKFGPWWKRATEVADLMKASNSSSSGSISPAKINSDSTNDNSLEQESQFEFPLVSLENTSNQIVESTKRRHSSSEDYPSPIPGLKRPRYDPGLTRRLSGESSDNELNIDFNFNFVADNKEKEEEGDGGGKLNDFDMQPSKSIDSLDVRRFMSLKSVSNSEFLQKFGVSGKKNSRRF